MLANTSWQVIVAAILSGIGVLLDVLSQIPAVMDSKTGQTVFSIGTGILGIATTFGLYHAKGKTVTTGTDGQNKVA